ncbi:MAG: dTDP-4-dehydrorhamnose 3,5-epimerase family protein [Candidatus Hatepunaea meridiana]|nr:dTDP-4-dehydrorhamnose 3,5-epimerase family protein [Candidatus Hatepunaea meridiana]
MIEGVKTKLLKLIPDERGRLMEILREDDEMFERFGQVYMTTTYPSVVKAWHYHHKQSDNVTCVKGMIKLVLHDPREGSSTKGQTEEYYIGEHRPMLVHIPTYVYHGWKGISDTEALIINMVTQPYDYKNPDEHRRPWDDPEIGYDWSRKFF